MPYSDVCLALTLAKFAALCASVKCSTPKTTECKEVLASMKWHVTARWVSVLMELHISDVKLTTDAFKTTALAFSLASFYLSSTRAFKA